MDNVVTQVQVFIATYGLKIIGAIVILIVGRIASSVGRGLVHRALTKAKVDAAVASFLGSGTYFLILTVSVLAALANFGIQTASFIAILGAAGFAVGFALQGSLSNFAAGVLLLLFRPFKIGDFINGAGEAGTVKEIALLSTTLATPDNVKITIPNGKLFGDVIKNYSGYDTRRVDLVVGISYGSDIQKAYDTIVSVLKAESRLLPEPEPQIAVSELADSSVNFVIRPWVNGADYWAVRFDLTRKIKEAFDQNGIEIPFPQHTVHMASAKD